MHYTRFLACMFKHEETILILVSNQSYSADLHLQEIIIDTFIIRNYIKGPAEKLKNELF